eukprot:scaffold17628_cov116-Isochrysis_galbana.AAC.2
MYCVGRVRLALQNFCKIRRGGRRGPPTWLDQAGGWLCGAILCPRSPRLPPSGLWTMDEHSSKWRYLVAPTPPPHPPASCACVSPLPPPPPPCVWRAIALLQRNSGSPSSPRVPPPSAAHTHSAHLNLHPPPSWRAAVRRRLRL